MRRLSVQPMVGDGLSRETARRAKYARAWSAAGGLPQTIDGGLEPVCLVVADLRPAEAAAVQADSECLLFPANLDEVVSDPAGLTARLAALGLPVEVQAGMGWRAVAKQAAALLLAAQQYDALAAAALASEAPGSDAPGRRLTAAQQARRRLLAGLNLETPVRALPAERRAALDTLATRLGAATRSGDDSLRAVLGDLRAALAGKLREPESW